MNRRKAQEAQRFENGPDCVAFEYAQPTTTFDMARIELNGRYPSEGWALNTVCEAIVHVASGKGNLLSPDAEFALAAGDQLYISPNEKYAFEGTMELLFASTPKWSLEQARHES